MKNIVLLGAPGAGKGTQALLIAAEYQIPHISTGDILRFNIKSGTELGLIARTYIDKGALVPDEVVIDIVKARLDQADAKNGYVLDGFPRTLWQAAELDKFANVDIALNLVVPFESIIERLSGRRVCSCGETYNVKHLGGVDVCKKCGSKLFIRDDDRPETVKARLTIYETQTAPLIEYYQERGLLVNVDADDEPNNIFGKVRKALND